LLCLAGSVSAATIGVNFVRGAGGDGSGVTNAVNGLLPEDLAGAPAYAQTNWNNLGTRGTNIVVVDSTGAPSITINWDASGAWSQGGGGTPTLQPSPDANLINSYLDSNGGGNAALVANLWLNNNNSKPLVYLTGLSAWLAGQGVTSYDLVLYSDGDATSGRVGEYWLLNASGPPTALVYGSDLTSHTFICDRTNFIAAVAYAEVPATVNGGPVSQRGNFQGNYMVFNSLTNDTFLIQTAEFNTRAPINAIQIIPRATRLPAQIDPLPAAPKVLPGGTLRLRAQVAGLVPFSYRWQKNGGELSDGGNISGATTATLTVANVSAGDVAAYSLVVTNPSGVVTSSASALALATTAPASYAEDVVNKQPVAYWRFEETGDPTANYTAAYDYRGGAIGTYGNGVLNGFNSIVGPRPTDFPGFEVDNAAMQSGRLVARSWVVAPPLVLSNNTVSICAWIYPTAAQTANTAIFASRGTGADIHALGYGGNNALGYTWTNGNATFNFASGLVPPTSAWSLVALVVTPTNAILYCYNAAGQLSATNTIPHFTAAFNGLTTIGTDPNSTTTPADRAFSGSIDEVAVFNRSLSDDEIRGLYKKGIGVTAIPPVVAIQPKSYGLMEGRSATFVTLATGEQPLSYQWRRNGAEIPGATSRILTRNNVTIAGDAGDYELVVTNIAGAITSVVANLTVVSSNSAPKQYEAKLRQLNPISYWRLNETNGSTYAYDYWGGHLALNQNVVGELSGPRAPDFTGIETTNNATQYDGLSADTSTSESLMNNRAQFSIIGWFQTAGPIGQRVGLFGQNDVCEFGFHGNGSDGLAQIGIFTPRGSAFLLQSLIQANVWYLVAAIGDGTNVSLRLVSTNGAGGFQVLQANTGHTATTNYGSSAFAFKMGGGGILDTTGNYFTGLIDEVAVFDRALSVNELSDLFGAALLGGALPPSIASPPASVTLYASRTATFKVSAVGTTPQYRWRSNTIPISNGGNVFGVTTDTLTITNVSAANQAAYDVVVTNGVGAVTSTPPATLTVITPALIGYEAAVLAANPIAYWRLNELDDPASGTAAVQDYWGGFVGTYGVAALNGFNSVAGPQPADGFAGFPSTNTAGQFVDNTADSWINLTPLGISTDTATMTAWIKPASAGFGGIFFNRGSATGLHMLGSGNLAYHWNDVGATFNFDGGLTPPLNVWSFYAVVVQPTQATLYLINTNGTQTAVNTTAHAAHVFTGTTRIGSDPQSNDRIFDGAIDEVAIFNRALSAAEIQYLYQGVVNPGFNIQRSGGNVTLSWSYGTLLQADEITGPWTTNSAVSPYSTPASGSRKFYRLILQ
jgi:hypothetical protein